MATVSIQATIGYPVFSPPTERRALLSVASALLPGALVLANAHETRHEALVLLLGHITECLLKSIALKSGNNSKELRKQSVRHNLVELWRLATIECTQLQIATPHWVEALNRFHNDPYASRYMRDVAVYSLPAIEPALEGIISLHAQAKGLVESNA
jgi:hypothetical protein